MRFISGRKATLQYPIPPAPRTAVLVPWLRPSANVRVFENGWNEEAARFAPAALAATRDQLLALVEKGGHSSPTHASPTHASPTHASPTHASPTHAILVLGRRETPRLTEDDRDRLWRAFRVPIYEQILGDAGELLAAECEAHDGLHIESSALAADPSAIDYSPCPCGRATPRFALVRPAETLRRVAAYAR